MPEEDVKDGEDIAFIVEFKCKGGSKIVFFNTFREIKNKFTEIKD